MERTLFGFIWRYSKRQQVIILLMTVVSFPILYMTLELPKWIVNDAISGEDFPKDFLGLSLEQLPYLISLCLVFLGLVVLNNVIKYLLNMTKGVAGERMLRRLRYMLYHAIMRFRLSRFRRVSGGEIIPMITAEVEDVGVFIGEAIATPAFQGGTLLVYVVFIFAQDPFLGAAAISLYPLQAYVIPKLQRRVIMLTRERIKNIRTISDRINESVNAAADIHANDTTRYHLADLSDRLFLNYRIRLAIFKRKFMIKFLNNFLNQLPPFFFYSVGGYLVIEGRMSFGALVAVLAAYKDLASPWKELLNWYQNLANVSVKYQTVVENFDVEDALPSEKLRESEDDGAAAGEPSISLNAVTASVSGNVPDVTDITLRVPPGAHIAVFGRDGSGRGELLLTMAGLVEPTSGVVTLGDRNLEDISQAGISRHVSYVGADPYVFNDTIRGNLVYGLKTGQQGSGNDEFSDLRRTEATLTGNSLLDITAPWENHERAGVADPEELDRRLLDLLELVGLDGDLFRLGLSSHFVPHGEDDHLVEGILAARAEVMRQVAEDPKWAGLVELWREDAFNQSATIGENVLFGVPSDTSRKVWSVASDGAVCAALREAGVLEPLVDMGAEVAGTMIELFSDTGADASIMGDYSFLSSDEMPVFEKRLREFRTKKFAGLSHDEISAFVNLAFRIVPGRHRIVTIDEEMEARFVAARGPIHQELRGKGEYALLDPNSYVAPLSVEENVLFGKPRVDRRGARDRIDSFLRSTIDQLGYRADIARAGLNFEVGVAGARLSASQRRRIGLVRALVKRPDVLIFDGIADGDPALMRKILDICTEGAATVVVGSTDPNVARLLSTVAVMREGQLVATGGWDSVRRLAIDGSSEEPMEEEAMEKEAS
ncbi:MAG: ABC transporter transmembrane domain-containing protein [Pseudomonadota bacterium]